MINSLEWVTSEISSVCLWINNLIIHCKRIAHYSHKQTVMTTKSEKKQPDNAPAAKQAKHKTKAKAKEEAAHAKVAKGKAKGKSAIHL
jgi:hypothetical protein